MIKGFLQKYLVAICITVAGGGLFYTLIKAILTRNTGFETKTLWDWMELLIIPFVLVLGAYFLNRSERITERSILTDHQQENALQTYIAKMTDLLLTEKLLTTKRMAVRDIARTLTLSVLRGLDSKRKGLVLIFLYELNLINGKNPIIKLENASLHYVDLHLAKLPNINLSKANLFNANLNHADFNYANFEFANLYKAELNGADLRNSNLRNSTIESAQLFSTKLMNADLTKANLSKSFLRFADLSSAVLKEAILLDSNLEGANLNNTDLRKAIFIYKGTYYFGESRRGASIKWVELNNANLQDADITEKQIASANSKKGAILPNGTLHH